jgi:protease-4
VQGIAKGRVWLGETALQLGLVDELGGWHESIAAARTVAGLKADAPVKLVEFPKEKGLVERLLQKRKNSEHVTAQIVEAVRPVIAIGKQLGIFGAQPSVIKMPEFQISQ